MHLLLFLFIGVLTPTTALGQCASMPAEQLEQQLARANDALNTDNLIEHGAAVRQIRAALPCLDERLPVVPWSEFLVGLAIVEYTLGREWSPYLDTAYRINVNLSVTYGPPDIRQHLPKKSVSEVRLVRDDAEYYLDGLPLKEVGQLKGLHIAQRTSNEQWETVVLDDMAFPETWLLPQVAAPESSVVTKPSPTQANVRDKVPRGGGLMLVGSAMTAAGALGVATTFAMSRVVEEPTTNQVNGLKAANLGSWGVAIAGAGLGVTGVLLSSQSTIELRVSTQQISVRGTFK